MELRGVALFTEEDTIDAMIECLIDEFLRLGHGPQQILALFRNPHYSGMHLAWENRGEAFIRKKIEEVFGWWKRPVDWSVPVPAVDSTSARRLIRRVPMPPLAPRTDQVVKTMTPSHSEDVDPTGSPTPEFNL